MLNEIKPSNDFVKKMFINYKIFKKMMAKNFATDESRTMKWFSAFQFSPFEKKEQNDVLKKCTKKTKMLKGYQFIFAKNRERKAGA